MADNDFGTPTDAVTVALDAVRNARDLIEPHQPVSTIHQARASLDLAINALRKAAGQ